MLSIDSLTYIKFRKTIWCKFIIFLGGDGERRCVNMSLIFFDTQVTITACKLLIRSPEWSFPKGFCSSFVVRRALTPSQKLQSLQHLVCNVCRIRRRETVNFMTLTYRRDKFERKVKIGEFLVLGRGHTSHMIKKNHYFYEHFLLYSPA